MGTNVFVEPDAQILYPENGVKRALRNLKLMYRATQRHMSDDHT